MRHLEGPADPALDRVLEVLVHPPRAAVAGLGLVAVLAASAAAPAQAAPRAVSAASTTTGAGCATPVLARPMHGARAAAALRRDAAALRTVASRSGVSTRQVLSTLSSDETAWVDTCGQRYYVDPAVRRTAADAAAARRADARVAAAISPRTVDAFALHSLPSSSHTLYLDFTGRTVTGTSWNSDYSATTITAAPFDLDGASSTFSAAEKAVITSTWARVAEDYAPFDVDVTTEAPPASDIDRSSSSDTRYGTRVIITPTDAWADCGCGGIAYLSVFDDDTSHSYYQPAWVFSSSSSSGKDLAEAAAHEAGHNFGLDHDGTSTEGYYAGQGIWAPIMGVGYYEPLSQWSQGEYSDANNTQDDLSIIASHGATVLDDDHGDSRAAATSLGSASSGSDATTTGLITTRTDVDWFAVTMPAGAATLTVTPADVSPDLDTSLTLYDADGTSLQSAAPTAVDVDGDAATGLDASITRTLTAGTYYLKVDGVGQGTASGTGYSDYGSLGAYTVTASTEGVAGPSLVADPPAGRVGAEYFEQLDGTGGTAPYTFAVTDGTLPDGLNLTTDGLLSGTPTAAGEYPVTISVTDADGAVGTAEVTFSVAEAVTVSTTSVKRATLGRDYEAQLEADASGDLTWSVASGDLPDGVELSTSGLLSGTPTAVGTSTVTVQATDAAENSATADLTLVVVKRPSVTTHSLKSARKGRAYSVKLSVSGGVATYRWSKASGRLPAGLKLTSAGRITGKATKKGTYTLTVRVTDFWGAKATRKLTLKVK